MKTTDLVDLCKTEQKLWMKEKRERAKADATKAELSAAQDAIRAALIAQQREGIAPELRLKGAGLYKAYEFATWEPTDRHALTMAAIEEGLAEEGWLDIAARSVPTLVKAFTDQGEKVPPALARYIAPSTVQKLSVTGRPKAKR